MAKTNRKFDLLSDVRRQKIVKNIIAYFKDEKIRELALLLRKTFWIFSCKPLAKIFTIWQLLIQKKLLKQRFEDLEVDLDILINKQIC